MVTKQKRSASGLSFLQHVSIDVIVMAQMSATISMDGTTQVTMLCLWSQLSAVNRF
jgi:hypothetical protein